MYLLFEETGKFLAGRILSEADTSAQVELDSGKRVKVKAANMLLKFEKPTPHELMAGAQAVAAGIELDMAWEFAPEGDFGFADRRFTIKALERDQRTEIVRSPCRSCRSQI